MNIDKYKQLETVKLCYLKHRGNVLEIAKELNLPAEYIKKISDKFKKQEDRDVAVLISNTLMSHILLGVQSRTTHLMEMLTSLNKQEKPSLSVCCNAPYKLRKDGQTFECGKCFCKCEIHDAPKTSIYNVKRDIIEQLREEDKALIEMAKTMGYTAKTEGPPPPIFKQNILVVNGGETNPQVLKDIQHLPPIEKEKLLEKLRREMTDINEQIKAEPEEGTT